MCSQVAKYYIYQNSDTTGAGDIMLNIQSLIKFPIPQIDSLQLSTLCISQCNSVSDLAQAQMDDIIYRSYNLSEEEIRYIQNV